MTLDDLEEVALKCGMEKTKKNWSATELQLEQFANGSEMISLDVIKGKLEKIKNDKGETSRRSIYGYTDTVSTSILSKDQILQAKAEILNLKKQKQQLNDEVLELNIKTEVPLSDDTVATLQAEGLL